MMINDRVLKVFCVGGFTEVDLTLSLALSLLLCFSRFCIFYILAVLWASLGHSSDISICLMCFGFHLTKILS